MGAEHAVDMVAKEEKEVENWQELLRRMVELIMNQLMMMTPPTKITYSTMVDEHAVDMVAKEEEEEAGDWSDVPYHMVELIMNKLMTPPAKISDYVRCGAVCTSWRTVFIHHHPPPGTPSITLPPFLIVPKKENNNKKKKKTARNNNTKSLSFYNIIHKKVYNEFNITIPSNRHIRGSSNGWLVAVDQDNDCQIRLFNPFLSPSVPCSSSSSSGSNDNRFEILLPSLKDISIVINETIDNSNDHKQICIHRSHTSHAYLRKAILSADPLSNPTDYIVMAILGSPGRLAYCRPGGSGCHDKAWTLVEFEYTRNKDWGFRDVIYYKGRFYALYYPGTVVVLDPTRNMMTVTLQTPRPGSLSSRADAMYLVEYAGSLLQVHRSLVVGDEDIVTERRPYSTTGFRVFKLWDETKKMNHDIAKVCHAHCQEQKEETGEYGLGLKWRLLKNLCGRTLFLGDNHSMWIRASDYPGCKPNSIYFTDDFIDMYHCTKFNGPHDLGVFNLVDGTIENHYPTDHDTPIWPIPIWFQPIVQVSHRIDAA